MSNIIIEAEKDFQKVLEHLKHEYASLQIGRASAALVEGIMAEAYGTTQPIKSLANISIPDPKTIQIQPWDKSVLSSIEKGIRQSALGLNPVNEGTVLRIVIPALTQERRQDLSKLVFKIAEESRISIRNIRQNLNNKIKESEKNKEINEDEMHGLEKKLQLKVDEVNKEIDVLSKKKESEILAV